MSERELSEDLLRGALKGRPFLFQRIVGSTNDLAREWALTGAPEGALVIAEEQQAGRGRFGRSWFAPPGTALLFSVILRPHIDATMLTRLIMVGAVAVSDALAGLPSLPLESISLKWPNDVLLEGHKVAGILSEAVWDIETSSKLQAVILGIGLNVRIDFDNTKLADQATSIERVTGTTVNRLMLLSRLLARIDHWAARVHERSLLIAWRGRLATIGQSITVQDWAARDGSDPARGAISGVAVDVEDDGTLLLRTDDGTLHRLVSGTITLHGAD